MTPREFLTNVGIILVLMAAAALIEAVLPLFRADRGRARLATNLGLSALTLVSNWALISLAALAALRFELDGHGLLARLSLPGPLLLALAVVVLDLATWLAHRTMHALPALWSVHRLHHADTFLDVTTTLRQHPLEGLWRFLWILVPTWLFGLPAAAVLTYRLLSVAQGILEHANVRVWQPLDGAVSTVWVTPNMHKVHHSCLPAETDSNYGNLLALFDRAFGTFTATSRAASVRYGLGALRSADGPRALGPAAVGRGE
jgi:sterol desaturase/sphingolipid hydroxylase (fatty acid hydroxylase superfamily)